MKFLSKPFLLFCLALTLLLSLFLKPVTAVSLTDSRVTQLEYQVRSLQTQVSQLQSNGPAANGSNRPTPAGAPTEAPAVPGDLSQAQQFDNLATLVIEINQRVKALEAKVFH